MRGEAREGGGGEGKGKGEKEGKGGGEEGEKREKEGKEKGKEKEKEKEHNTHGEEKVGNVMGNVNSNAHVGKVETIAQPDEGEGDDVMQDQLLKVLSRLLQHQQQDQALLGPVAGLEQIVGLEQTLVGAMGEAFEHARCVEVPDGGARHDVHAKGTVQAKVDGRVELLHEAALFGAAADAQTDGQGADHALHQKLTGKAQHNRVKGDKGKVGLALGVLDGRVGTIRGRAGQRVGQKDAGVEGVRGAWVDCIESKNDQGQDERVEPGVTQRQAHIALEEGARLASFGPTGETAGAAAQCLFSMLLLLLLLREAR